MEPNSKEGRLVVYTVLMGQVAELNPIVDDSNVDYICFTDQDLPEGSGWEIRRVAPVLPADIPRSSRHPKILPHLYIPEYDRSIYVDSSVQLKQPPQILWSHLVSNEKVLFGAMQHSYHSTVLQEIVRVSELHFDTNDVLDKTVWGLLREDSQILTAAPVWGGIIARKHMDQKTASVMEDWFTWVTNFSRRDQITLPLVIKRFLPDELSLSTSNNFDSKYHFWPTRGFLKPSVYTADTQPQIAWRKWTTGLPDDVAKLLHSLVKQTAELASLLAERDSLLAERDLLLNSNSWKITGPLREVHRLLLVLTRGASS